MARIRLRRREIEDHDLPRVCARCGRRSVANPEKTLSWHPSWVLVLLFVGGLPVYVIVALALTKRMTVPLPLCERHQHYWRNRAIFVYGGLLGLLLLAAAGVIGALALDPNGQSGMLGTVCILGFGVFLVWLIAAAIMQVSSIRTTEITDRSIALTGLSREFTDAVYDDREAAEEEADRRWRERSGDDEDRPRGRRRAAKDDDRYYDAREKRRGGKAEDDDRYYEDRKEGRRRQREADEDY